MQVYANVLYKHNMTNDSLNLDTFRDLNLFIYKYIIVH